MQREKCNWKGEETCKDAGGTWRTGGNHQREKETSEREVQTQQIIREWPAIS